VNNQKEYIKQLGQTISKFLEPIRGIPFPVAIKALTGFKVLTFDISHDPNKRLLKQLSMAAQLAGQKAFQEGIFTARPNEAGSHIEPLVVESLRYVGLKADKPISNLQPYQCSLLGYVKRHLEKESTRNSLRQRSYWPETLFVEMKGPRGLSQATLRGNAKVHIQALLGLAVHNIRQLV